MKLMRASRLLAILILLQNRGRLTAASLAQEFEVSERTVYRDIDALSAAGVPVYGDRGPGGGFALLDGYRTKLTGLADEEAAALALAGVPSAADAIGFGAALRDAFGKLFAALPAEGAARASGAAARFHIDPVDWYRGSEVLPFLPRLAQAVLERRRIAFIYESWSGRRVWALDPLGLVLKGGDWYLVGRSQDFTGTFRAAAVSQLQLTEQVCAPASEFVLAAWWRELQSALEARLFTATATLRASTVGCARLARLSARGRVAVASAVAVDGGWHRLEMQVEDSEHGARELIALGPEIEVLHPLSLRQRVQQLAGQIAGLYTGDVD